MVYEIRNYGKQESTELGKGRQSVMISYDIDFWPMIVASTCALNIIFLKQHRHGDRKGWGWGMREWKGNWEKACKQTQSLRMEGENLFHVSRPHQAVDRDQSLLGEMVVHSGSQL